MGVALHIAVSAGPAQVARVTRLARIGSIL
jgi:hypothetical protein